MNFIKSHWFGILICLWLVLFVAMMVVVLIAPHNDAKNRGFAFCTHNLINTLENCNRKIICSTKAITDNTVCDIKIITNSFYKWLKGDNRFPWSDYIFSPEKSFSYIDEEERKEYLNEFPDTLEEMEKLKQLRKDMEDAQNEYISKEEIILPAEVTGMGFE